MAKTYILEPTELEFTDGMAITESVLLSDEDISAIPSNAIASVGDETFKLSIITEKTELGSSEIFHIATFTPNGEEFDDETYDGVVSSICKVPSNSANTITRFNTLLDEQLTGTYTVSIYTEEDDPEPTPSDNPFSKNIVHNDHPYNAVERIRAKLKQKIDEGEDEEESGEDEGGDEGSGTASGGIMKLTFTEDPDALNPGTYVCDHTWQEIHDALNNGDIVHGPINVDAIVSDGVENLTTSFVAKSAFFADGQYILIGRLGMDDRTWAGESADEYPATTLD